MVPIPHYRINHVFSGYNSRMVMDKKTQENLRTALHLIEAFRSLDENMPIQQAAVFLTIALNEGASQKDIAEIANLGQGSASRNIAAFLSLNRFKRKGHNLLRAESDPMELRIKRHYLSKKGTEFAQNLAQILRGRGKK